MTKTDITILASEHCIFSGVVGPMDMFLQAGVMWNWFQEQKTTPYFNVRIATLDGNPVKANNEMLVVPHCSIEDIKHTDLIILPSQGAHFAIRDEAFYQRVDWIKQRFNQGCSLASICTGAFSLAATGLLDGKMATTHWGVAHAFRETFPDVNLRTDRMVTEENRLFCGGGTTADLSLTLYLINKYCGREVALQSSRCSLVDLNRLSQLPFSIFMPDSSHGDIEIKRAQTWIEDNYAQSISVDFLAEKAGMSPRQFNRRFKVATQETVTKYIQLIRIEAGKRMLEKTMKPFDEISNSVGYENVSFFRRLFKKVTSKTPMEYRKMFYQFI